MCRRRPLPRTAQGTISLNCPANVNVTINMNQGISPGGSGSRNMMSNGNPLNYQLYRDATRTQVWGTGTGSAGGKVINPTVAGPQTHDVYGQIGPNQSPGANGTFTDTVVVSLT